MASRLAVDQTARTAARALGWTGDGEQDEVVWAAAFTAWGASKTGALAVVRPRYYVPGS